MTKYRVVLLDGTKVEIEADKIGYSMDGQILELKDKDYRVVAAFYGFQYWRELNEADGSVK